MFKKTESSNQEIITLVGKMVKVEGKFYGQGNMIIEGIVDGSIKTENDLRIEQGAVVKASIKAKNIYIAGIVEGNIKAQESIELASSAKVFGDIETKLLSIEKGSLFYGNCKMGEIAPEKKEKEKEK
ncbi:MAG: hypothetical protein Athens101410_529 [Parcubacteria group bacterium Athens1014_10]|nr:MAG: hypothetical protein Athens101410_529 [Parcubacteria group bacterium Athens1014_10]TSD05455.1 MAG: hypothetical protein Athens071412_364 [Parcubacteria group bacterium Athens0714_12]